MSRKTKWSKENLLPLIQQSISKAEVLRKLQFKGYEGGHYRTLNKYLLLYNIDTDHFPGQGWRKNRTFAPTRPIYDLLVKNSFNSNSRLKERLLKEDILKKACCKCGISEWNEKSLSLHLDHINGVPSDNRLFNLRLLCPNCHSQTSTYCRSNISRDKKKQLNKARRIRTSNPPGLNGSPLPIGIPPHKKCIQCKKPFVIKPGNLKSCNQKYCSSSCYHKSDKGKKRPLRRKVKSRPTKEELAKMIDTMSWCAIGRKYNVSDNAIRKWARSYKLI